MVSIPFNLAFPANYILNLSCILFRPKLILLMYFEILFKILLAHCDSEFGIPQGNLSYLGMLKVAFVATVKFETHQ